jgi:hypothetical protein
MDTRLIGKTKANEPAESAFMVLTLSLYTWSPARGFSLRSRKTSHPLEWSSQAHSCYPAPASNLQRSYTATESPPDVDGTDSSVNDECRYQCHGGSRPMADRNGDTCHRLSSCRDTPPTRLGKPDPGRGADEQRTSQHREGDGKTLCLRHRPHKKWSDRASQSAHIERKPLRNGPD